MRKSIVALIAVVLVVSGAARAQEKSMFRIYLDDRTPDNFIKAFESYESQRKDTMSYDATVTLAYLNLMELEKNLDLLGANVENLGNRSKFQYANILLELERYDEAIDLYCQLNVKAPKWSCPWRHKGEAYWKKKDYADAVEALEKAIETRETHYDAYVMLARVLRDMGDNARALDVLEKGLTYYGKDIEDPEEEVNSLDMNFLYLDLLEKNGMTEKHRKLLEKIRRIAPDDERLK